MFPTINITWGENTVSDETGAGGRIILRLKSESLASDRMERAENIKPLADVF